jgi:hypothetical protein
MFINVDALSIEKSVSAKMSIEAAMTVTPTKRSSLVARTSSAFVDTTSPPVNERLPLHSTFAGPAPGSVKDSSPLHARDSLNKSLEM